jgi:small-conductance mechanosensitive channel
LILAVLAAFAEQLAELPQIADEAIVGHLNLAIGWYRQLAAINSEAGQPSDTLYLSQARSDGRQAVQLAFQAAQSIADLQQSRAAKPADQAASDGDGGQPINQQSLANALQNATDRLNQDQANLDILEGQIAAARGRNRQTLISQRATLQAAIELDKALQDALQKISGFASSSNSGAAGLPGRIAQLKQSVPEVFANAANEPVKSANNGQSASLARAESSGLVGQAAFLLTQTRDVHGVDNLISLTTRLRNSADDLQKPLRETLRALIQQGRGLANPAPGADLSQITEARRTLQQLTAQFKQLQTAALPLRQEMILLDQVHGNLQEWRNSLLREYALVLRSLLTRVFLILLALGVVVGLSALWRSATLRYIHDARRRRQVLLVRRFVSGFLMLLIVLLGFVSEFSSLATFAGFITAGIAVALQTVILSVAAYFTLIGRRGVRVGDRITVAGVTGDVLEIGLVRLHLMELGGTGIDLYPTGRVVVFSNSILFGAIPLYKQLPGTSYTWHELVLSVSPDTDPGLAQKVLTQAADSVYSGYRKDIEHQHAVLERVMDSAFPRPEPTMKWQFTDTTLELVLRYPVEIQREQDIDDQMTREVMHAIAATPELKAALSGTPKLRAPVKA